MQSQLTSQQAIDRREDRSVASLRLHRQLVERYALLERALARATDAGHRQRLLRAQDRLEAINQIDHCELTGDRIAAEAWGRIYGSLRGSAA